VPPTSSGHAGEWVNIMGNEIDTNAINTNNTNETNTNMNTNTNTNATPVIAKPAMRVPSPELVTHWLSEIDGLVTELGSYLDALTPDQRRRELKIRKGGERHIPLIADTATRYGLSFPGGTADEIRANLDVISALSPVLTRLQAASGIVGDTIFRARGNAWRGTTSAYTMLSRMAKNVPSIAREIAPATEFFAPKRKSKVAAAPPVGAVSGSVAPVTQPGGGDTVTPTGGSAPVVNGAPAPANGVGH
jgi:hypothetical protein